jgi:hypothetical protein
VLIKAVVKVEPFINIRRPKWKGTAAILKNIPIVTSIIPIGNQIGSSADCDNSLISITSKLPIAPYIKQIQKSIIPDAKIPSRNTLNQLRYF